jgi:hypothetical protein
VQVSNAEISSTITATQVEKLPALGRDPLALIQNLPGVTNNENSATTINRLRNSLPEHDARRHQYPGQLPAR